MTDEQPVGKAERQQALVESIVAGQQPPVSARARIERLLSPAELEALDEQILLIVESGEPEPETGFFDGLAAHQAAKNLRLRDALLGYRTPEVKTPPAGVGSFDGGARQTPAQPESHEQTLIAILRSGAADVGSRF